MFSGVEVYIRGKRKWRERGDEHMVMSDEIIVSATRRSSHPRHLIIFLIYDSSYM